VRKAVAELVRPRGLEVGSTGLGGCVYILRGPHDPVQIASVQVDAPSNATTTLDRDSLLGFGMDSHAAAIEAAVQGQLRRPFRG